jgi:hypothetical protein
MDKALVGDPLAGVEMLSPSLASAPFGDAVVCVPVRNEARRLPALIAALDRQVRGPRRQVRVLLLLNNCTDASRSAAERAAATAARVELRIVQRRFPAAAAHAGSARRAAMEAGRPGSTRSARDGLLLTTDADAVPAADWMARSHEALAAGADIAAAAWSAHLSKRRVRPAAPPRGRRVAGGTSPGRPARGCRRPRPGRSVPPPLGPFRRRPGAAAGDLSRGRRMPRNRVPRGPRPRRGGPPARRDRPPLPVGPRRRLGPDARAGGGRHGRHHPRLGGADRGRGAGHDAPPRRRWRRTGARGPRRARRRPARPATCPRRSRARRSRPTWRGTARTRSTGPPRSRPGTRLDDGATAR